MPSTTITSIVRLQRAAVCAVAVALLGLAVVLPLAAHGAEVSLNSAGPAAEPVRSTSREQFTKRLHGFAMEKAGTDRSRYFALVRRGMDRFDALAAAASDVARVESSTVDLAALDATPAAEDIDPNAQFLTSLRVGVLLDSEARIVDGFEVPDGRFEEVVVLSGNGFICSGVALDSKRVLTAAHCACDLGMISGHKTDPNATIKVGNKINHYKQRFEVKASATRVFPSDAGFSCLGMEAQVRNGRLDLAVVEVAEGAMQVSPARFQKPEIFGPSVPRTKEDGPAFFIFGFGCAVPDQIGGRFMGCRGQNSGGKRGGIIYYSINCAPLSAGGFAPDPVVGDPLTFCTPDAREFILSNFFAKSKLTTDTCAGDSGGPVMQLAPDTSLANRHRLVGITSRSLHPLGHCGFGGVYTKVSDAKVMKWLRQDLLINVQE